MIRRPGQQVSLRKQPQQARSSELVTAVLEAALQVLAEEGAQRFTTARVAERAGVSIGSLYQYFPNKAAILFRLQTDEWRRTGDLLRGILADRGMTPVGRLRRLVHAFVQSECDEADMRVALNDAAPLYRDAPEAQAVRAEADRTIADFMAEALPAADAATRTLAGDLIMTTLSTVGKDYSETPRQPAEIVDYAAAMADMLCAYLALLQQR
jgi:AcrR family transcriptional regulator